jgi:integrase
VAATVRRPASGRIRREGQALTLAEPHALTAACAGPYRDVVPVLALAGLRWGELAGLQVGDRVSVPGPGLRLSRAVLASGGGGALYVDTLKNHRARTVPLVAPECQMCAFTICATQRRRYGWPQADPKVVQRVPASILVTERY